MPKHALHQTAAREIGASAGERWPLSGLYMLSFEDPRWNGLEAGYRTPIDLRPLLQRLESDPDAKATWQELWEALYHQGDVGEGSFAAVPHLVRIHRLRGTADWNTYALAATIELARGIDGGPQVNATTLDGRGMSRRLRVAAPIAAAGLAAGGGVFFGLLSCGGYAWHSHLFWALLTPCLVFTALAPTPVLRPVSRRLIFIASVLAGFVVIRGAASTFYPGSPASLLDFLRGTWLGITTGPC